MLAGQVCWPMNSFMLYCGIGRPGGGCGTSPSIGTTPPAPVNTGGELSSAIASELGGCNKFKYKNKQIHVNLIEHIFFS